MTRQRLYRHSIAYRHARQQHSTRAYAAFGLCPPAQARGPGGPRPPAHRTPGTDAPKILGDCIVHGYLVITPLALRPHAQRAVK